MRDISLSFRVGDVVKHDTSAFGAFRKLGRIVRDSSF